MLTAVVTSIVNIFSTNPTEAGPSGADAVRTAVNEFEQLAERSFDARLGEPDVVDEEDVEYFNNPKIVVPILNSPFESVNRLVFDVPDGREDEASLFIDLLNVFDLGFDSMEDLEGVSVPMFFLNGNASVMWDQITDDSDKGEDEISQKEDPVEEEEGEDGSSVNVEERVVSNE